MSYKDLQSFQQAAIIYDFTVEFCRRYVDRSYTSYKYDRSYRSDKSYTSYRSDRMVGQMEQAARSGKQNIAEGCSHSKIKPKSEHYLLSIASASLKELIEDYEDFLRQRRLLQWGKDDPRAVEVRRLAYRSDRSYTTYKTYLGDPEAAANAMITLINQTTYLIDQEIKAVGKQMEEKGIAREAHDQKLRRVMREERKRNVEFDSYLQGIIDRAKEGQSGMTDTLIRRDRSDKTYKSDRTDKTY